MGVPAFYRWLSRRYPKIVVDCIEEKNKCVDGVNVPVDTSLPNPNGIEFDNLYLDMNGIIHPCFHPEDRPAPTTELEVFQNIFDYIDRLFAIVRPRKLLYMAIDGVAPRAKMNQQRSRRFRSARDNKEKLELEEKTREEFLKQGVKLPEKEQGEVWDSNAITPGTPFMDRLAIALQYYIYLRINNDSGWRNIEVILSDSNTPGEGEHKIMTYVREQRGREGWNPNTQHCICGLDADLIFLSLATHEPHFVILREEVLPTKMDTKRKARELDQKEDKQAELSQRPFQFLMVNILREYLQLEFVNFVGFEIDFERLIDDFVLMCCFCGNDFLPHMPSLNIREGGIDLLMTVYKQEASRLGGHLTEGAQVNLERVELFIQSVASNENKIFAKRVAMMHKDNKRRQYQQPNNQKTVMDVSIIPDLVPGKKKKQKLNQDGSSNYVMVDLGEDGGEQDGVEKAVKMFKEHVDGVLHGKRDRFDEILEEEQMLRLGEPGWRDRYYLTKLKIFDTIERESEVRKMVRSLVEGVCWVMRYYYESVPSWTWFYPFHYAPFASDIKNISSFNISFDLGKPFSPYNQLMGVLPAGSKHCLPECYQYLFDDPKSPILEFYPEDFVVDMNGKRFEWQGVTLLPFIDEERLLAATAPLENLLVGEEKRRNITRLELLFVHQTHPLADAIQWVCQQYGGLAEFERAEQKIFMQTSQSYGMSGYLLACGEQAGPASVWPPFSGLGPILHDNKVVCGNYTLPEHWPHESRILEGTQMPKAVLGSSDRPPPAQLWHEQGGPRNNFQQHRWADGKNFSNPNNLYNPAYGWNQNFWQEEKRQYEQDHDNRSIRHGREEKRNYQQEHEKSRRHQQEFSHNDWEEEKDRLRRNLQRQTQPTTYRHVDLRQNYHQGHQPDQQHPVVMPQQHLQPQFGFQFGAPHQFVFNQYNQVQTQNTNQQILPIGAQSLQQSCNPVVLPSLQQQIYHLNPYVVQQSQQQQLQQQQQYPVANQQLQQQVQYVDGIQQFDQQEQQQQYYKSGQFFGFQARNSTFLKDGYKHRQGSLQQRRGRWDTD